MSSQANISLKGQRVFVTGASGFIGRRVVAKLVKAGGDVTVLSRSRRLGSGVHQQNVAHTTGNIGDADFLYNHLLNHDILINLAYDVRASGADNMAGFDALIGAAERAGIKRIVHISSIVVYDGWPFQDLDETCASTSPGGGPYRQTKIKMEHRLLQGEISAAILQPTIVYGPASALWTDQLARALMGGGIVLPSPAGLCNGVFVDDVAQAVLRAATLADIGQDRFIISGKSAFGWAELLDGYVEILGQGAVLPVPLAQLQDRLGPVPADDGPDTLTVMARISAAGRRAIGQHRFEALVHMAKRRLTKPAPLYPDHHLLGIFSATGTCSINHAQKRLGYDPEFDLASGLKATQAHLLKLRG